MTDEEPVPAQEPPECNPLHSPPCACPHHSPGPGPEPDEDEDSALLRALRARMNEENRLRRWARGQS